MTSHYARSANRNLRSAWRLACATAALVLLAGPLSHRASAQIGHAPMQQPIGQPGLAQQPMGPPDTYSSNPAMEERRLRELNAERQKSIVADTNRLVKLAAELNGEINGAHPASLTGDQLRKLAEIEKLAHSVREKMSTPLAGYPRPMPAPAPLRPNPWEMQ